jgi:hypothetical protein
MLHLSTPLEMYRIAALSALLGTAIAQQHSLGAIESIKCADATCHILAAVDANETLTVPLRLSFYGPSTVRWWLALDGNFSNNVRWLELSSFYSCDQPTATTIRFQVSTPNALHPAPFSSRALPMTSSSALHSP